MKHNAVLFFLCCCLVYHQDLYAELQLSSDENSSNESLYNASASGESGDEHEADMDVVEDSQPAGICLFVWGYVFTENMHFLLSSTIHAMF